jgi:hypothetical protein
LNEVSETLQEKQGLVSVVSGNDFTRAALHRNVA